MPIVGVYSFVDVAATLVGPGGFAPLGNSAAPANEGITVSRAEKNTMTIGADGSAMHSLRANASGKVTIRLLKTSPINAVLSALYNFQAAFSLNWGQNVLTINELVTGDNYLCEGLAFAKHPDNVYATEGNTLDWEFEAAVIDSQLGTGVPNVAI